MRVHFAGLVMAVGLAATISAHAEPPRPRIGAAATLGDKLKTPSGKLQSLSQGHVTWSYLRVNRPQLLVSLLAAHQAANAPQRSLSGLANDAALAKLKGVAWSNVKVPPHHEGLVPRKGGHPKPAPSTMTLSPWADITHRELGDLANMPDFSVRAIDLKDAWGDEHPSGSIWLTPHTDGVVTATLPAGVPFRITRITSYDGVLVATAKPGIVLPKPWESKSTGPFSLPVHAGQDVQVSIEFAASAAGSGALPAGVKTTSLELTGTGWKRAIPVRAHYTGPQLGVALTTDDTNPTMLVPAVTTGLVFDLPITLTNFDSRAVSGSLSAAALPGGFSWAGPLAVALGPNEKKSYTLHLGVDPNAVTFGPGQPATFTFAYGARSNQMEIDVGVAPTFLKWVWDPSGSDVNIHVELLEVPGMWAAEWWAGMDSVWPGGFAIRLSQDGSELMSTWDPLGSHGESRGTRAGRDPRSESDWASWSQKPAHLWWYACKAGGC